MQTIQISEEAYSYVVQYAEETERTPSEVASEIILGTTAHPYIEHREGVLQGKPVIKETRIPVWQLAEKLQLGDSIRDICDTYPHVSEAAIYDAISYYFDNRAEINEQVKENQIENVLEKQDAYINERGMTIFRDVVQVNSRRYYN